LPGSDTPSTDDKDVLGEAGVLRIGDLVDDLPGNDHGHDDGLAAAGGHFAAQARERTAVAGNGQANLLRFVGLGQPDEGFDGLQLAEEEA
jgi:hypothetical protein